MREEGGDGREDCIYGCIAGVGGNVDGFVTCWYMEADCRNLGCSARDQLLDHY